MLHDQVLVALISTVGSVAVAFITSYQNKKPSKDDELEEEIKDLKEKLEEKDHEDN